MRFSRAFKAITSELYHSGTHPLRFNVRIHSIGTTNTWHCCLLSTTSQLIKLSILKLTRFRSLPAIQKKNKLQLNETDNRGHSSDSGSSKMNKLVIFYNKNVTFKMVQVSYKKRRFAEANLAFFLGGGGGGQWVGGFIYANMQRPLSWLSSSG